MSVIVENRINRHFQNDGGTKRKDLEEKTTKKEAQ